jgi:DNA-binding GntR family transcriptional regulator
MPIKKDRKLKFNKPIGLSTQVADMLIQAILEGDFKGGDQLVENDLQKQFGVSRSPLREAFRELEKKGLVDIVPRKGTFVKRISRNDIEMHFPVRAALEALAAKQAFMSNREETADRLSGVLSAMEEVVKAKDTQGYYRHHLKYHEIFIDGSDNDLLIGMVQNLRMQNLWYTFSYQYYNEDLEKSLEVHRRIVALFQDPQTDPEAVRSLVEHHVNIALDRFLAYLEEFEKG